MALVNMDSPGCMGAQEIGFSTSGVAGDTLGDILRRCTGQAEVVIRPLGRGSDLSFFGPRIPIQVSFDFYQAAAQPWPLALCRQRRRLVVAFRGGYHG